ncbi:MAG: ATP-binding cassette domain-containing protein [Pseudomonadota bacterium]
MTAPLIEARGLGFRAGGRALIADMDVSVRAGRRTVVLGANGAGKSLLLRLLHGLLRPSTGQILWQGRPLDRAARARQAMVFQTPVMMRRSALANLRFALAARGLSRAAARMRAEAALEDAGLEARAAHPARLLSGGEQQRLALARALALAPEILFLDEPTASLDPASTLAIETQITAASRRGVTVVLVTHDIGQARRLGNDALFLSEGRLVEAGPAAALLDAPRSREAEAWVTGRVFLP